MFFINKNTVIHQLAEQSATKTQMMSYIIETPEGNLILIDGGNRAETDYLINYLYELKGTKPVIKAWFLTHAHSDHIDAFLEMTKKHSEKLEIKKILYNFPDEGFIKAYEPSEAHTIKEFNELLPKFEHKTIIVEKGDVFVFDNVVINVLYVPDPTFTVNAINNSSIIFKMEAEEQSILFLGDLGVEAGNKLLKEYGSEGLKSDFIQMAHHGQDGVSKEVYEAIRPKACLWSTPEWLWNNDAGLGYNTHSWKTIIVRNWMDELKVKHHFITKDGIQKIVLPYHLN